MSGDQEWEITVKRLNTETWRFLSPNPTVALRYAASCAGGRTFSLAAVCPACGEAVKDEPVTQDERTYHVSCVPNLGGES